LVTLGALGCFHFHLTARRLDTFEGSTLRRRACYTGAALCCAAAGLSNAVGAAIPLLITAWDALTLPKPKVRRMVKGTAALWVIGLATVLLKGRYVPADAVHTLPDVLSTEWLLMIVSAYGLNLKTLVWPTELGILYEWIPSYGFRSSEVILGGAAIVLTLVLLWKVRRQTLIVFGLAWFLLALAPTSQIMPHHIARADRFLYLPLVGLVISVAATCMVLCGTKKRAAGAGALGAAVLLMAAWLSAQQVQTWQNSFTMWRNCLRVAPYNPMAHRCFAELLAKRGRFDLAIPHYHMALRVEPSTCPRSTALPSDW
jgi:protein O-mannosyl-transferase